MCGVSLLYSLCVVPMNQYSTQNIIHWVQFLCDSGAETLKLRLINRLWGH